MPNDKLTLYLLLAYGELREFVGVVDSYAAQNVASEEGTGPWTALTRHAQYVSDMLSILEKRFLNDSD